MNFCKQESFLGLTIHYVNSDWKLYNFLLNIIPFTISYSGMNIANKIMRVLNEFNISNKIIAFTIDNESAMLVCERKIGLALDSEFSSMIFSYYHCTAYVLNLGIKQGLKLVDNAVIKTRCRIKNLKFYNKPQ